MNIIEDSKKNYFIMIQQVAESKKQTYEYLWLYFGNKTTTKNEL